MGKVAPFAIHQDDCAVEAWDDASRGATTWRTLVGGAGQPSDSLTAGVAEIPPGPDAARLHRHAHAEIYYVLAGRGVVEIDGEPFALRPGTAVFIPGGAEHAARNTDAEPLRILYAFAADAFGDVVYRFSTPDPADR